VKAVDGSSWLLLTSSAVSRSSEVVGGGNQLKRSDDRVNRYIILRLP
jgi:hypothetical protein